MSSSRALALLAKMTLAEKIGQLVMVAGTHTVTGPVAAPDLVLRVRQARVGSVLNLFGENETQGLQEAAMRETRLGIPLLFGLDVVHGFKTIFPVPLAEAAVFDPDLWERTARAAAEESVQVGLHLTFAPMLDVARDPRWGRICESPGEDPWLGARFAEAKVKGFQSPPHGIAATAKHFVGYGAVTAGRDYAPVDMSERALQEIHLPPFAAAVAAGAAAIMPAFTDIAGVPLSAHPGLLHGLLRERWGFDGVLISDYNAIAELIRHGVAADLADASALALKAGIDIDMMSPAYEEGLPLALERGQVTIADIDAAVLRVLALKERLGLFDTQRRKVPKKDALANRQALAREAARRSIVLLSQRKPVLPLKPDQIIAVIGPLAQSRRDMLGSWAAAGADDETITILEGVRTALPNATITFARGTAIDDHDASGIAEAVAAAGKADLVLLCLGEACHMSGEAACRAIPELPGCQRALAEAILDTGKTVVVLLSSGRPLMVPWLFERAHAVLATWFLGSEAGHAIADVLTGRWAPSGKLPVTWPRAVGQIPIFHAQRNSGRPENPADSFTSKYLDLPNSPQFPFGHGLSTTQYAYSDLRVPEGGPLGKPVNLAVTVANTGSVAGEETVFVFLRDIVATVARPMMELKAMAKVALGPGERKTVALQLAPGAFQFFGLDGLWTAESGEFEVLVGPSADRACCLSARIRLS